MLLEFLRLLEALLEAHSGKRANGGLGGSSLLISRSKPLAFPLTLRGRTAGGHLPLHLSVDIVGWFGVGRQGLGHRSVLVDSLLD